MDIDRRNFLKDILCSPLGTRLRLPEIYRKARKWLPLPAIERVERSVLIETAIRNHSAELAANILSKNALLALIKNRHSNE